MLRQPYIKQYKVMRNTVAEMQSRNHQRSSDSVAFKKCILIDSLTVTCGQRMKWEILA